VRCGIIEIVVLIIACILAAALLGGNAHAAEINTSAESITVWESNESGIIDSNATVQNLATTTTGPKEFADRRIEQGSCVNLGETVDIAGIGWYTGYISYYGRYYDDYGEGYNVSIDTVKKVAATELDHYYIDPDYFRQHLGWWYLFYPVSTTSRNDRLFYVSTSCNLTPKENATMVQKALNQSRIDAMIRANLSQLTVKTERGIDYIISKNESTSYDAPAGSHMWIFGAHNDDTYYDIAVPDYGVATFDTKMTNSLPSGAYDVVFIQSGKNTINEEIYNHSTKIIASPFKAISDADTKGFTPDIAEKVLFSRITLGDDNYTKWKIQVSDPTITVEKLAQTVLKNNQTLVVLSGYTNLNQGDEVLVTLDANTTNSVTRPKTTWATTAINNGGGGAYRAWNMSVIVDFNNVFPGPHFLTVSSDNGGSATVPIYVRQELAAHYNPPEYLKFVDNSPFIAPIYINTTITIPVPGPTKIVTVTITPSEKQIKDAGTQVATVWYIVSVVVIVAIIILIAFLLWMRSVYRRARL